MHPPNLAGYLAVLGYGYSLIVSPDKVGDTLDSARSRRRRRRRRTDFLRDAITEKIFALGLSNLVWGLIWGRTPCLLFCSLGLP